MTAEFTPVMNPRCRRCGQQFDTVGEAVQHREHVDCTEGEE